MKIYCPKCHTCYSVEAGLIPEDGKKLRCSRCGEVWICQQKDIDIEDSQTEDEIPQNVIANEEGEMIATPAEPEVLSDSDKATVSEDEMSLIFSRLKNESNKLDTERKQLSPFKKIFPKIKKLLGWDNYFTITLEILVVMIIIGLGIVGNRYALVRKYPQLETVFSQFGIPSRIIGEGLSFQNVVRSYNDPDNPRMLTIKGFISNQTGKELPLPTVLINILNADAENIHHYKRNIEQKTVVANGKIPFTLEAKIPIQSKYIILTFTE